MSALRQPRTDSLTVVGGRKALRAQPSPAATAVLHDPDAEMAVVGSILIDPSFAIPAVARIIEPAMFGRPGLAATYAAALRLASEGREVDNVSLRAVLEDDAEWDAGERPPQGWSAMLTETMERTPVAHHAATYARRIRELAIRRDLMAAAQATYGLASDRSVDVAGVLADVRAKFDRMDVDVAASESGTIAEALADLRADRPEGYTTGIGVVDQWLQGDGLIPAKVMAVSGRTGVGKTWLALMMIAAALDQGARVIDFTLEMSRAERCARLGAVLGLGAACLRLTRSPRRWTDDDHAMYLVLQRRLEQIHYTVFQNQRQIADIAAIVRRDGADVVVIDYYQNLVRPEAESVDQADQEMALQIERLAQLSGACVIVVAQVNKGDDLKYGAWLKARADAHLELANVPDTTVDNMAVVKLALHKNRWGPDSQVGSEAEFVMDKAQGRLLPRYEARSGGRDRERTPRPSQPPRDWVQETW